MIELSQVRRPAEDILSRSIRFTLGGQQYVIPVRSIRANREWKSKLDASTIGMLGSLEESADDLGAIMAVLAGQIEVLIDLLIEYDTTVGLPSKEDILDIEPDASMEVLAAIREVWRAANPLVAMSLDALTTEPDKTDTGSSAPTSSPPPSTAGRRKRSKSA